MVQQARLLGTGEENFWKSPKIAFCQMQPWISGEWQWFLGGNPKWTAVNLSRVRSIRSTKNHSEIWSKMGKTGICTIAVSSGKLFIEKSQLQSDCVCPTLTGARALFFSTGPLLRVSSYKKCSVKNDGWSFSASTVRIWKWSATCFFEKKQFSHEQTWWFPIVL